jgi:hypothetical protein
VHRAFDGEAVEAVVGGGGDFGLVGWGDGGRRGSRSDEWGRRRVKDLTPRARVWGTGRLLELCGGRSEERGQRRVKEPTRKTGVWGTRRQGGDKKERIPRYARNDRVVRVGPGRLGRSVLRPYKSHAGLHTGLSLGGAD